jgi:CheY-like chemotaxis protein
MLGPRHARPRRCSLLGREPIDLVILDIALEGPEDGLEVLAHAAPRGLPCLIFTARNEADLWGEGWSRLQAKGATDLLLKGMNVEEQLISKVAAMLSSSRRPATVET